MLKYLLIITLITSCTKPPKEVSLLDKHKDLREKYHDLMEYHLEENSFLDLTDPTEKELSLIHIDLAKEYAKLYLKEDGIIKLLSK